jgi:anti-sigma regulatory factor (Ser/Thr protein kinase)
MNLTLTGAAEQVTDRGDARRSGADPEAVRDLRIDSRSTAAAHPDHLPESGPGLQPGTSTAGGGPSIAACQNGGPAGRRQDWRLPAAVGSVTVLRRGLDDFLRGAPLSDDQRYDLLLAACEAASNAVEHAKNPREPFVEVRAEFGDARVTITVRDQGQWSDGPPGPHRGRGLAMMWILADTTVAAGPRGTTVTIRSSPRHGRHAVSPRGDGAAASISDGGTPVGQSSASSSRGT